MYPLPSLPQWQYLAVSQSRNWQWYILLPAKPIHNSRQNKNRSQVIKWNLPFFFFFSFVPRLVSLAHRMLHAATSALCLDQSYERERQRQAHAVRAWAEALCIAVQLKTAPAGLVQKGPVVLRAAKAASRQELHPSPLRRLLQGRS